jgi:hypothetical protein
MAVGLDVVVIDQIALYVHLPRVSVALFRHALDRPVRPDAELRVAKPSGDAVVLHERFPGWRNGPRASVRADWAAARVRHAGNYRPAATAEVFIKSRRERSVLTVKAPSDVLSVFTCSLASLLD